MAGAAPAGRPLTAPAAFAALVAAYGADPTAARAVGAELLDRYAEPHRRYHTVAHLQAVLGWLAVLGDGVEPEPARRAALAAWFHDAVYDPARADNEERSAALAGTRLAGLGVPADPAAAVAGLVRATATHVAPPGDPAVALLLDADLAVLGAPAARYAGYAAAVRAEYAHLPDDAFRRGRAAVLRDLLARPRLYRTDAAYHRLERAARANLAAELAALAAPTPLTGGDAGGAAPPP